MVATQLPAAHGVVSIQLANGTAINLQSYPQQYGSNSHTFPPLSGVYGGRPRSGELPSRPGMILALEYRVWKAPYVETIFSEWKTLYNPLAVIYYNTNESSFWGDGFPEWIFSGAQATGVDYPIVNLNPAEWYTFEKIAYSNANQFNLTIDSEGVSIWRIQRTSGAYIGFAAVTLLFASVNIVLAIVSLLMHPAGRKRSIASVCLMLEILANLVRLFFGMDPFAPWKLWPYPVESTLFTISIPISIMSMVLLTLYWQELVDFSSLEISSVLSRSKIPAAIFGVISLSLEAINSSVRAAEVRFDLLVLITNVIYLIMIIILIAHVSYVSISVFRFFRRLPNLNRKQRMLRTFSIRSTATLFGLIMLFAAALALLVTGGNIYGHFFGLFCVTTGLNLIGLMQIIAFLNVSTKNKDGHTKSSVASTTDPYSLASDHN